MTQRVSLLRALPSVYAAAGVRVVFPLVVLPLMAARLGAEEFGRLGLSLVWAGLLSLVVEGGFLAAATRQAVTADRAKRWSLAQQVFSARCALSLPVALVAFGVGLWIVPAAGPAVDRWETALLLAALACALGWPATWYLQASLQLHRWAWVELTVQLVQLACFFLLAHSVAVYLLLQCASATVLSVLGWRWLRRDLQTATTVTDAASGPDAAGTRVTGLWSASNVRPGLRLGGAMLPVTIIGSAYTLALPAVAAGQLGRSELGTYYLGDRLVRALVSALDPLMQLVYPRIVERFAKGARHALAYAAAWSVGGLAAGSTIGVLAWLGWPMLRGLIGGVDPTRLGAVLAVLGWLLPLNMGWRFFAYWMLGSGRYDRAYRACIVVGGMVGLLGAWRFGQRAEALAGVALSAEAALILSAVLGMLLTEYLRRR